MTLNVKARGFKVNVEVTCEDSSGKKIELTQTGNNIVNFGNVNILLFVSFIFIVTQTFLLS